MGIGEVGTEITTCVLKIVINTHAHTERDRERDELTHK